jgi:penicillin-binding protein 1C
VSSSEALIRSLNIPAVALLERYGYRDFYQFLVDAGLGTLFRAPEDYGLTLILGGAETTLRDLVSLYRGLGRLGVFEPLVTLENTVDGRTREGATRLLSPGSSALTLNILRELRRPGLEAWWERFSSTRELAWKTGTSYGNRDAWAVGVDPTWTVGVWVGNFSGESNPNLLSSATSAPLLFDVVASLPRGSAGWFTPDPTAFRLERICLDTGYVAGSACPTTAWAPAPQYAPTLEVCPYHRTIHVTTDGVWQVSSLCWTEGEHRETAVLSLPADVAQYLREQGRIVPALPPWKPGCPVEVQGGEIGIVYPTQGIVLAVPRDMSGLPQQVTARAAHQVDTESIYWYLDDVYLGLTTRRHAMPLELAPGDHLLEIVDSRGNRARVAFRSAG